MGVDLILSSYVLPLGREPDFERCRENVRAWDIQALAETSKIMEDISDLDTFDPEDVRGCALRCIDEVQAAYDGHRYSSVFTYHIPCPSENFHTLEILIVGGNSYGDDPYEGFSDFCLFGELGLTEIW